ncbi:MAG: imelysin family protein [bacterium]
MERQVSSTFRSHGGMLGGLTLLATLGLGCSGGGGGTTPPDSVDVATLLNHYASAVVLATYNDLDTQAVALSAAVDAFVATPNTTTLAAAQSAWVNTREPWEQSEGFLFGPVESAGLDPALDSWPVNRTDLDTVLNGATALTPATVGSFENELRGFHTIEYLLFDDGAGSRVAADIVTAYGTEVRRGQYLSAVTADLSTHAGQLADAWRASGGNYVAEFNSAGTGSTIYVSQKGAMQEIVGGMAGIADEVAHSKIAKPFNQHNGTLEESQFSDNSLEDFRDNLRSIQNGYLGSIDGSATANGIASFVADADPALDTEIRGQLDASLDALDAIPAPFRTALDDPNAADEIQAAIDTIDGLFTLLDVDLNALVTATLFEH